MRRSSFFWLQTKGAAMSIPLHGRPLVVALLLAWPLLTSAESPGGPTTGLSPELRAAFIAEMQHLDLGLQRTVSAVARADWPAAERAAREIKGSFILEQRLSPEQLAELHRVLPEPFLALDRAFHDRAERLAVAAANADVELATFLTYKLTEACLSCHAQFAQHRFPGLSAPTPVHRH
jgi:hypothetical protein